MNNTQPIIIFVEDYKNMSKEEFASYIKKIWEEGYQQGKADGAYVYYPYGYPYYNTTTGNQDQLTYGTNSTK